MNHQDVEQLLSVKSQAAPRTNVSLVLSPHIQRNAARLKKRRQDRIQALLCTLAALIFLALAAGGMYVLKHSANPGALMQRMMYVGLGGMALTLLIAPVLAWYSEKDAG